MHVTNAFRSLLVIPLMLASAPAAYSQKRDLEVHEEACLLDHGV